MARLARTVVPGMPHHIVQRGNRRQDVFFGEVDRWVYLQLLRAACLQHDVKVWAWCLMRNHVHVVAVPIRAEALAECFAEAHVRYTRWVNKRHAWQGHLWQARFGSSVLDERYLLAAVRYVERNPVRAHIVTLAWHYRWSSAAWHVGKAKRDPLVVGDEMLRSVVGDWRSYLTDEGDKDEIAAIRRDTVVNRPLGSEVFLYELEQQVGRPLIRRNPGRPWKTSQ